MNGGEVPSLKTGLLVFATDKKKSEWGEKKKEEQAEEGQKRGERGR